MTKVLGGGFGSGLTPFVIRSGRASSSKQLAMKARETKQF